MAEEYGSIYVDIGAKYQNLIAGLGIAGGILTNWTVKAQAEIDTAMRNIWTIVDTSKAGIDRLQTHLQSLSRTVPQTAKQLAEGYYQVVSASVDVEHALYVTEVAAKAASAGLSTTYTAVDALTSVLNAYSLSADKASIISDIMFKAVERGKMTYEQYAGSLGQVVTIAALAGISFEEVSAAMATMTRTGLSADMAATALRGTINAFLKPADDAKAAAEALGFDLSIAALSSQGLTKTMELMLAATKGNAEAVRALIPDVRGYNGVANLMRNGVKDLTYDVEVMTNSFGASERAFGKQADSLANKITYMKNAANEMAIAFGKVLTPTVVSITEFMQKVTLAAAELPESTQKIILLTTGLGTLLPLIMKIGTGLISLLSGPAGIVVAVGLLIAAIDMLIKKGKDWDTQAIESAKSQKEAADKIYETSVKITGQKEQLERLIEKYDSLAEKSKTNKTAQAELNAVIAEIGKTAPSVVTSWDSMGTAISVNIDKAKTKVKELAEQQIIYLEAMKKQTELTLKTMDSSISLYDKEQKKIDGLQSTLTPFFQAYKLTTESGLRNAVTHLDMVSKSSITNVIELWGGASKIAKDALKDIALAASAKFYEGRELASFKTKEELQGLMFDMQTMIRQYGPLETSLDARELELLGFSVEIEKLKSELLNYDVSIEGLRKATQTVTTGTGKAGQEKEESPLSQVVSDTTAADEAKQKALLDRIAQAELRSKVLTDEAEYYLDIVTKQLDITKLNSAELDMVLGYIRNLRSAYGDLFVNIGRADELDGKIAEIMQRQADIVENAKKASAEQLTADVEAAKAAAQAAEEDALRITQTITDYVKESIATGTFNRDIAENWRTQFDNLLSMYAKFPSVVAEVIDTAGDVNKALEEISVSELTAKQEEELAASQKQLDDFKKYLEEGEQAQEKALSLAKTITSSALNAASATGMTSENLASWLTQLQLAESIFAEYPEAISLVISSQTDLIKSIDDLKAAEIAQAAQIEKEQALATQKIYDRESKIREAYRAKKEAELKADYEASLEVLAASEEEASRVAKNVIDGIAAISSGASLSLGSIDSYTTMLENLLSTYAGFPSVVSLVVAELIKLEEKRTAELARLIDETAKIYDREARIRQAYKDRKVAEELEAFNTSMENMEKAETEATRVAKTILDVVTSAVNMPDVSDETLAAYKTTLDNLLTTYAEFPSIIALVIQAMNDLDAKTEASAELKAKLTEQELKAQAQAQMDAQQIYEAETAERINAQIKELMKGLDTATDADLDFLTAQLEIIMTSFGSISEITSEAMTAMFAVDDRRYALLAAREESKKNKALADDKEVVEAAIAYDEEQAQRQAEIDYRTAERAAELQGARYAGVEKYYQYTKEQEEELLEIEERRLKLFQSAAEVLAPKAAGIFGQFGELLKNVAIDGTIKTGQEGLEAITDILGGFSKEYFQKVLSIMSQEGISLQDALDGVNESIADQLMKTGTTVGKSLIEVGNMLEAFAAQNQGTAIGGMAGGLGSGSKSVGEKILAFLGFATEAIGPILETIAVVGAIFQAIMFIVNLIVAIVNFFKGIKEKEEEEANKPGIQISDITGTMADKIVIALDPLKALYSLPTYVKDIKEAIYAMRDSVLELLGGGQVATASAQGSMIYNISQVNIFAADGKSFDAIMAGLSKEARLAEAGAGA